MDENVRQRQHMALLDSVRKLLSFLQRFSTAFVSVRKLLSFLQRFVGQSVAATFVRGLELFFTNSTEQSLKTDKETGLNSTQLNLLNMVVENKNRKRWELK
jgi:hypothetical protein